MFEMGKKKLLDLQEGEKKLGTAELIVLAGSAMLSAEERAAITYAREAWALCGVQDQGQLIPLKKETLKIAQVIIQNHLQAGVTATITPAEDFLTYTLKVTNTKSKSGWTVTKETP